jgi:hypothetical protein
MSNENDRLRGRRLQQLNRPDAEPLLPLRLRGEVADFVQKERALVRLLERPMRRWRK